MLYTFFTVLLASLCKKLGMKCWATKYIWKTPKRESTSMGFFLTILWLTWFKKETALSDSSGATSKSTTYLLSKVRDRTISPRYRILCTLIVFTKVFVCLQTSISWHLYQFLHTFYFSICLIYFWSLILQCLEQCNHLPIFDVKPKWFAFFGRKKSRQSGFKDFSSLTNGSRKDRQIFRVQGFSHFTILSSETLNAFSRQTSLKRLLDLYSARPVFLDFLVCNFLRCSVSLSDFDY